MKKVVLVVLLAFVVFWMVTSPRTLADTSQSAGSQVVDLTGGLFESVIDFIGELGS